MRSRTALFLHAAFSSAILAACRDKTEAMPPPSPEPTATAAPTTTTAATPSGTATVHAKLPPTQSRYGQRCTGALVAALKPATPVDYLELRLDYYAGMPEQHEVVSTGQTGTPCATAKDKAKCTAALDAAIPKGTTGGEYLVYTRGDDVGTVRGKEVSTFLAPIENAEEAAMALVYPMTEGTSTAAVLPACDPAKFTKTSGGWETTFVRTSFCDERHETTYLIDSTGAAKTTKQVDNPPKPGCHPPFLGRRPEGLTLSFDERGPGPAAAGEFFAECTEMEAASVASFTRLERELHALGAPASLRRRARRSADDERRHARTMRRLARRFGGAPGRARVAPPAPRSKVALAIENATEGCVVETWAALLASWQAARATDPAVRSAMTTIARDETRHAALARDVAAWIDEGLTADERAVVAAARARALAELTSGIESQPSPEPALAATCGLPSAAQARALLRQIAPVLGAFSRSR